MRTAILILAMTYLFLFGCINLKLGDSSPLKATHIEYNEPTKPFILFKDSEADKSWQSNQTGNIIALFSDCSKESDKPLNVAFSEVEKGFDRVESKSQKKLFYNGREALHGEFKGYIDGIKVSMESILFNKNRCFYQLTFSGLGTQLAKEKDFFEKFKKEFKAP